MFSVTSLRMLIRIKSIWNGRVWLLIVERFARLTKQELHEHKYHRADMESRLKCMYMLPELKVISDVFTEWKVINCRFIKIPQLQLESYSTVYMRSISNNNRLATYLGWGKYFNVLICLLLNNKDDRNLIIDVEIIRPNINKALSINLTESYFSAARIKASSASQYRRDRYNPFDVYMLWTYLVDVSNAQIMPQLSVP